MAGVKTTIILFCEYIENTDLELTEKEKATFLDLGWINENGTTTAIGRDIFKTYGFDDSLWV